MWWWIIGIVAVLTVLCFWAASTSVWAAIRFAECEALKIAREDDR